MELNKYLDLNTIILHSNHCEWENQADLKSFKFVAQIYQQSITMFKRMEAPEKIYEGVTNNPSKKYIGHMNTITVA